MSGIQYEVLTGDALLSALRGGSCGDLLEDAADAAADEIERLQMLLAEAERNEGTLLGMIHHQRDVLRECLPYLNESMAGKRPGRCADDIRAAVKALTADSASGGA